ncbi:hypothetical protein F7734_13590 [Scytonema sp. UIC 10036]|uniref:hypothetical protein n=1 Tax=Scytonema sp. UIC 10036 TaxID=2304196 RepID=UPI0012DA73EC|nr:hypothetical protein [Scytonema sp. UIC 10036]MUG93405.1 hypothetical protein [Scytonema sp. UIC 10036]
MLTSDDSSGGSLNLGGNITVVTKDLLLLNSPGGNLTTNDGALLGVNLSNPLPITNGATIQITARTIRLVSVPEPDSILSLLAFAVFGAASIHKVKQKSKFVF